jgi:hemerythrin-like domain-containing protein
MATPTQFLRDEHQDLLPHIEVLRIVADSVGELPIVVLREYVDEAYQFLAQHLIPHAEAEDRTLYPAVAKIMGAPQATATMVRDHAEIARMTGELAALRLDHTVNALSPKHARSLRRVLYGLYALAKVHFAKEEEIYLSILDAQLTPEQAREVFEAMEQAAKEAKSRAAQQL